MVVVQSGTAVDHIVPNDQSGVLKTAFYIFRHSRYGDLLS